MFPRFNLTATFVAATLAFAGLTPSPAAASLQVCNKSSDAVWAAIVIYHFDSRGAISKGWWKLAAGGCATLIGGELDSDADYFVYGYNERREWAGDRYFCVDPNGRFEFYGVYDLDNCTTKVVRGFLELVPLGRADYTQSFNP